MSDSFYKKCIEISGVEADECVMIGDNKLEDMYMANKNGMKTVWIKNPVTLSNNPDFLQTYINSHIKIRPGHPFFATNVIDCDVVIYLKLDDPTYKRRLESRSKSTNRPLQIKRNFKLKDFIERDIKEAAKIGVVVEELEVG